MDTLSGASVSTQPPHAAAATSSPRSQLQQQYQYRQPFPRVVARASPSPAPAVASQQHLPNATDAGRSGGVTASVTPIAVRRDAGSYASSLADTPEDFTETLYMPPPPPPPVGSNTTTATTTPTPPRSLRRSLPASQPISPELRPRESPPSGFVPVVRAAPVVGGGGGEWLPGSSSQQHHPRNANESSGALRHSPAPARPTFVTNAAAAASSLSPAAALVPVPQPQQQQPIIRSEVGYLSSPERKRMRMQHHHHHHQEQQQQQPTLAPPYHWYHPPPSIQMIPESLMQQQQRETTSSNGGGSASLFGTASEAVSTLEQQYRAAMKQLDLVQGMYLRLNAHNNTLGGEFNTLRGQLEALKGGLSFGVYNDARRLRAEARGLRQYVDLVLRDFGQYLAVMGREVTRGVAAAVAEATGEAALLPYYRPGGLEGLRATAASVAAVAGPRQAYRPESWLGAISPRRVPANDGNDDDDGGVGGEDQTAGAVALSPQPGSSDNEGNHHHNSTSSNHHHHLDGGSTAQDAATLSETRRRLVMAEGKLRVTEQDCERRVRRVQEVCREREATMASELVLLRRALGMPTDDLEGRIIGGGCGGVGGDTLVAAPPMKAATTTLPFRGDGRHRDDGLLDTSPATNENDSHDYDNDSWGAAPETNDGGDLLRRSHRNGGDLQIRSQYAPLIFDSQDSRAVERRVRAAVAQSRSRQRRDENSDSVALGSVDFGRDHRRDGGSWGNDDGGKDDDDSTDHHSTEDGSATRGDTRQRRVATTTPAVGDSRQRWQQQRPRPQQSPLPVHRADRYSKAQDERLEGAALRLLEMVESQKKMDAATATASSSTQQQQRDRPTTTITRAAVRGPPVRRPPGQEQRLIAREAGRRGPVASGALNRPAAPSDVTKVAQGLWAEQLLAQRGIA